MLSVTATDRLDVLVEDLAARLAGAALPPTYDECIVVQSLSLRRWLQQRLAAAWGCAAGLDLPFPSRLATDLEVACGLAAADDPWDRDRLRWRIAGLAESASGELAPLAAYLAAGHPAARPAKRLQLADRIADLLDSYQIYRPEMLAAWEEGKAWAGVEGHVDEAWQAALWRRLRRDIAAPPRSRRHEELLGRLRRDGLPAGWHRRVSVLATGVLPPRFIELLEVLAELLPVAVWLTSPLPQPWGDVRSRREAGDQAVGHPLVASLGRQARDWFRAIGDRPAWAAGWSWLPAVRPAPRTLLGRLQAQMRETAVGVLPILAATDHSLTFACCHGPRREVEVARDAILAACAELPDLRPHEILVLAPDVGVYGPLVEAVFTGADPAIRLPVRIADRTLAGSDAVAEALLAILALAPSRCGLGEVLDLLELPAVRIAAGLAPEQVAQAHGALRRAGLRWGRDLAHRRRELGAEVVEDHGTLAAAIDRLALGWALGPEAVCGRPASGAEGAPDHDLLGALLTWLQRLGAQLDALAAPRPLADWGQALHAMLQTLLAVPELDAAVASEAIDGLAGQQVAPLPVTLGEVSAALATALGAEARSSDFVSGSITVCGLKPMRMVPARVIVLLGMDDAGWPRRTSVQPFDLVSAHPRAGDRLPREDDRQLLLEAVLAAEDRLLITWPGRAAQGDPRHERPPSACLGELFAAVDAAVAWSGGDEQRPSRRLTTVHPLQPFARAYLAVDGVAPLPAWDARAIALARALCLPPPSRPPEAPFADLQPPPMGDLRLELDEMVRWWQDPAGAWCRARLGAAPRGAEEGLGDDEPLALDGRAASRLAGDLLLADDRQAGFLRAAADGDLPLGGLGRWQRLELERELAEIDAVLAPHRGREPLRLSLAGADWTLDGQLAPPPVDGVLRRAHHGAQANGRSRLDLAIRLLVWNAWQAERGEPAGRGQLVARSERWDLPAHGPDAPERLQRLLELTRGIATAPLPFFPQTAWRLHEKRAKPLPELLQLAPGAPWASSRWQDGERDQPAVALAWRGRDPLTAPGLALMLEVWGLLDPSVPRGRGGR